MSTVDRDTEAVNRIQKSMGNINAKKPTSDDPQPIGDVYNELVANALYRVFADATGNGRLPEGDFQLYERAAEALNQRHPAAFASLAAESFKGD